MSTEMMNRLKEIADRRKASQSKGGAGANSFFKPDYGETKIRFLPSKNGSDVFFKEFGEHWVDKKPYICPKVTSQEKCPICEVVSELYNSGSEEDLAAAKEYRVRRQNYANIIVRGRESDGPKVYKFGIKIQEKLIDYSLDEDYYDLSDPNKGFDFRLNKEKKDGFPNYDKSKPVKDATEIDEDDLSTWLDASVDVHSLVTDRIMTYNEIKEAFTGSAEVNDVTEDVKTESLDVDNFMDRVNKAAGEK